MSLIRICSNLVGNLDEPISGVEVPIRVLEGAFKRYLRQLGHYFSLTFQVFLL